MSLSEHVKHRTNIYANTNARTLWHTNIHDIFYGVQTFTRPYLALGDTDTYDDTHCTYSTVFTHGNTI
jgi:hypothetical protein